MDTLDIGASRRPDTSITVLFLATRLLENAERNRAWSVFEFVYSDTRHTERERIFGESFLNRTEPF